MSKSTDIGGGISSF